MNELTRRAILSSVPALPLLRAQAPEPPETPAGEILKQWLTAINSGNKESIAAYAKKYEPQADDNHIDMLVGIHQRNGGFDLAAIEKSEPLELSAIIRNRKAGEKFRFWLQAEDSKPPIVAGINIEPLNEGPPPPKPDRMSLEGALRSVDEFASAEAAADRFSGALLIALDGKSVFEKAWGQADREAKRPNTVDTQFRIGSMNKMFTAVATLQLVSKGKLALTDPIGKHMPDYPNSELASKVTVRHLLTHTGGTGDIFGKQFDQNRLQLRTIDDYVKLYGARPLAFAPGSRWTYSNYGFILLGALIQKTSGKSYYDFVQENVFAPAGMKSTASLAEEESVEQRSKGYMKKGDVWVDNKDTLPYRGTSAGGGYSTVGDLFRFALGLHSGKLLDRKLLQEAIRVQEKPPRGNMGYGYGFIVETSPVARFGHGGGAPGMNGELFIYPENGFVISALSNFDPPAAGRVARHFADRMPV